MRRARPRVTLNADGTPLGGFWSDLFGTGDIGTWSVEPTYGTLLIQMLPIESPQPADAIGYIRYDRPPGYVTWYKPNPEAITQGKITAAIDTINAAAEQVAATGSNVLTAAGNIGANIVPILIAIAAFYLFARK